MPLGYLEADNAAMGTMNRPLQACCPLSRCPGYFVKVHNRALRTSVAVHGVRRILSNFIIVRLLDTNCACSRDDFLWVGKIGILEHRAKWHW